MLAELGFAFGIGLAATASPCALPLYPGFLAYLAASGDRLGGARVVRWLGLFVLAGVLTMMLALGALISTLSVAVGQTVRLVTPVADLVVISLGIALLLGANPFKRLPTIGGGGARAGGSILTAYVYGLLYGPIALPCSGALLISIFSLSLSVSSFVDKMTFFLAFGLGFGVPLLAISLLAPAQQSWLLRGFSRHYGVVGRAAGALLIAVGTWDLSENWPTVRLYLGV